MSVIRELWERLRSNGPGWYWIGAFAHHGDLYHACSLAEAFRAEHGAHLPLRLVVSTKSQAALASLFQDQFASVILEPHLPALRADWWGLCEELNLPPFGPESPLVFFPDINLEMPSQRLTGDRFLRENQMTWMALYRVIFHLPEGAEPAPPRLRPELAERAADLCRAAGVVPGRSVILFPYAQHWPVAAALPKFAALAKILQSQGWSVFTSTVGEEVAVPGARPIHIPFDLLIDAGEHAGWAIGIRSGVWDVLSSARCRKTILHHQSLNPPVWGTDALELERDARQLVVDFEREDEGTFCARVLGGEALEPFVRRFRVASDRVAETRTTRTLSFVDAQRRAVEEAAAEAPRRLPGGARPGAAATQDSGLEAAAPATRLIDLTRRDHPRWGPLAGEAVKEMVEAAEPGARFYTCRDRPGAGADFYEEVDAPSLLAGRYHAARFWHSVIVAHAPPLQDALPGEARRQVLTLEPMATGEVVRPGAAFGGERHRAAAQMERPFSFAGLQLIDGWSGLEPWGVWTLGARSVLKVVLPRSAREALVVSLRATASVSDAFPALRARVRVNGEAVLTHTFTPTPAEVTLDLRVPREVAGPGRVLWMELEADEVRSPREQGREDDRRIGIGLQWLSVRSELEWRLRSGALGAVKAALGR